MNHVKKPTLDSVSVFSIATIPVNFETICARHGIVYSDRFKQYILPFLVNGIRAMSFSEKSARVAGDFADDSLIVPQIGLYRSIESAVASICFHIMSKQYGSYRPTTPDGVHTVRYCDVPAFEGSFMMLLRRLRFFRGTQPLAITTIKKENLWILDCYRVKMRRDTQVHAKISWYHGTYIFYPTNIIGLPS